ncbi:cell division protein FtsQ/DivIB [Bacillus sonorensis]|uniref:Cell division protein DivIB n=2 Tax=Bacillus sonorensis TaxID=119858 RepID=M5PD41_9BACI|nr:MULTISPECIES: cell division protein FtsQ/DivIB [Bacillus]TWK77982.1 Cell division protein DivIB [Bacillus paralicheniformis]ASB89719.1 Cell division protein DivIB [Bacillus sonorensis]EME74395.1 division initiation protein DivIB [Bacillus sonorensis L12]MCZ0073599.1 cell division protein FtsQ/DivIB [Bacillus sonorensis]MCZ0092221.1 cell division protein FtsQ/DivIB [Bacillus sonorensis]
MKPGIDKEKVVNIEERIPKIKEQRKQKANRRLITFILLFFTMMLIIIYLQTPISKVSNVEIKGNRNVPAEDIISLSQIYKGQTEYWSLNKEKTAKKIEKNKLVKKAEVSKKLPNKIEISIEEYKSIAFLQKDHVYYSVLENGTVLPEEVTPNDKGPILNDWPENEKLIQMAKQLNKLPDSVKKSISEINYAPQKSNPWLIRLYMNDGYMVTASIKTFAKNMENYPAIVKELPKGEKGIIHLEVAAYFESLKKKSEDHKKEEER